MNPIKLSFFTIFLGSFWRTFLAFTLFNIDSQKDVKNWKVEKWINFKLSGNLVKNSKSFLEVINASHGKPFLGIFNPFTRLYDHQHFLPALKKFFKKYLTGKSFWSSTNKERIIFLKNQFIFLILVLRK